MAKLHVYLTNRPMGDEVEVPPYGLFKNGASYDIDDPELEQDITLGDPDAKDEIPRFKVSKEDANPGADLNMVEGHDEAVAPPAPVKTEDTAGLDASELPTPRPAVAEPKKES